MRMFQATLTSVAAIASLLLFSANAVPSEVGYLTVASVPPAKVYIDDFDTGRTTPIDQLALPPGNHRLRLEAGALKRVLGFKITTGQTTRLKVNL